MAIDRFKTYRTKGVYRVKRPTDMDRDARLFTTSKEEADALRDKLNAVSLPGPRHYSTSSDNDPTPDVVVRTPSACPDLLALAYQYRNDMRWPPSEDSRQRRIAWIEHITAKAESDQ